MDFSTSIRAESTAAFDVAGPDDDDIFIRAEVWLGGGVEETRVARAPQSTIGLAAAITWGGARAACDPISRGRLELG